MAGPRSIGLVPESIRGRAISTENAFRCCQGGGLRGAQAVNRIMTDIIDALGQLRGLSYTTMTTASLFVVDYPPANAPRTLVDPPPTLRPGRVLIGRPEVLLKGMAAYPLVLGLVTELLDVIGEIPVLDMQAALLGGLSIATTVATKEASEGCESCISKSMWKRKEKQVWTNERRRKRQ